MARIGKAKKAALKAIAMQEGITLQEAITLANAAKAHRVAAKKTGNTPAKGTVIGEYVEPLPVEDTKEVGKELSIAHKEIGKALTKGGEQDKRKVRPFVTNSYGTIEYKSHLK